MKEEFISWEPKRNLLRIKIFIFIAYSLILL